MRIVLAGNYNEKRAGANFYATVRKLTNGFVRNGHLVIPFSDRDVAREESRLGIGRGGEGHVNRRLLELCENFRPDLLVMLHADKVRNDTVRKLRAMLPALRVAMVNLDASLSQTMSSASAARRVACDFLTTAGDHLRQFVTPTHRVAFIPNPADRSIETLECFARDDQPFDFLCTIGTERTSPRRGQFMREIAAQVPEARYAFYGLAERPYVYGSAYFEAIACGAHRLNLNQAVTIFSIRRSLRPVCGSGLLVFVSQLTGWKDFFGRRICLLQRSRRVNGTAALFSEK